VCELYLRVGALQDLTSSAGETNGADLPDSLMSLFWCLNIPGQLACCSSHCRHMGVSIWSGSWLEPIVRKKQKGMLQCTEPEHLYGAIS